MHTAPARSATLDSAATTILDWHGADVLHTINVAEAYAVGDLFAELGRPDVLAHIIRETWETENNDDRDPTPWRASDGHRIAIDEPDAATPDGYTFAPRLDWEGHPED